MTKKRQRTSASAPQPRRDASGTPRRRLRVGEFAQSWIRSKALRIDRTTARTYALALDRHILPALGDFYYDELTCRHVQDWIDDSIRRGWTAQAKGRKGSQENSTRYPYRRSAISVWLRTLRTMSRDAMAELDLPRDPTIRVELPRDDRELEEQPKALTAAELGRFLDAFHQNHIDHYALVATLAFTGLRFCHASALRWEDWDEAGKLLRIQRKHVRGKIGPVSLKKRAPREYPVEPQLADILQQHRERIGSEPTLAASGWMFPSRTGTLRTPNSMDRAWAKALATAGISRRFTVHGLRYTFTDLIRRANVDAVIRRAMTGHVTEEMQRHYSHVDLDEKRAAMAGVFKILAATDAKPPGPSTST